MQWDSLYLNDEKSIKINGLDNCFFNDTRVTNPLNREIFLVAKGDRY